MINPKAFAQRIEVFRKALAKTKSSSLADLYRQAIRLTEDASWQMLRLFEAADAQATEDAEHSADRHEIAMKQLDSMKRDLAEIESSLAAQDTEFIRASQLFRLRLIRNLLERGPFEVHTELLDNQATARLRTVEELAEQLTAKILAPDRGQFVFTAAIEGINFAIGLIPGAGTIYSALLAANNIGTDRSKKEKNADEVNTYLDEYSNAITAWIAAAESAISALNPIDGL